MLWLGDVIVSRMITLFLPFFFRASLLPNDVHLRRCIEPEADLVAPHLHHDDANVVAQPALPPLCS